MKNITAAIKNFKPQQPGASIPALIHLAKEIENLPGNTDDRRYWKAQKLQGVQELMAECAGLWAEVLTTESTVVPGDSVHTEVTVLNRSQARVYLQSISYYNGVDVLENKALESDKMFSAKYAQALAPTTALTTPYYLKEAHEVAMYVVKDQQMRGRPEATEPLQALIHLTVDGYPLQLTRTLTHRTTDPVRGALYLPLEVVPPVVISTDMPLILGTPEKWKPLKITFTANTDDVHGLLKIKAPQGWNLATQMAQR